MNSLPVSILVSLAAGACAYLFVLNRYLIEIHDRRHKFAIVWGTCLAAALGSAAFGYAAAGSAWMVLPALVLVAALVGEVRRAVIRRRCRGGPPTARENDGILLTRPVTTTDLAVARYELRCPEWRGPDIRIAHVADLHVNHHVPLAYYKSAMQRVAQAQPDLVFLAGDFVSRRDFAPMLPEILAAARGRLGTLAVLGNHDYWASPQEVAEALRAAGVTVLGNGCVRFYPESRADTRPVGASLAVCGYEAPWGPREWRAPDARPGELVLVLTHTPDNVFIVSRTGVAAVFAGHYHAGQIRVPALGSLVVPSDYGRLFDHGHFIINGTHLFVTAGVGAAVPPLRIYCQPDIFIVDIKGTPDPSRRSPP